MASHGDHADGEFAHPMPIWMLLFVFVALTFLTILTVFQASFSLGNWEIWLSMIIASIKATLVMAFFMHLAFDKPFNVIMFLSSFLFVTLFVGFLLMDTNAYDDKIIVKPVAETLQ
ncbi:MAG: cytochrome C oxidase subunit IV family protein [Pirellulaceae bacterium]